MIFWAFLKHGGVSAWGGKMVMMSMAVVIWSLLAEVPSILALVEHETSAVSSDLAVLWAGDDK